jgi:TPR repeat protein
MTQWIGRVAWTRRFGCWTGRGASTAIPETTLVDETHQKALAGRALASAIALLETVFQEHHQGAAVPAYEVVDEGKDELQEACYRALIENNPADQHQVALLLRTRLEAQIAEVRVSPDPDLQMYQLQWEFQAQEERTLDLLRYASDAGHAPSRYQYGLALTEGRRGKDKVMLGANLIAMACRDGEIDALAWCGRSALYGTFDEPVDYALARGYLERAAAEDHPIALSLLSVIHRDGLGIEPNAATAFALTLRAADAGYAVAQYETAVALIHGRGIEADPQEAFKWFWRASDAGLPQAKYALARSMLENRIPGEAADIESLLVAAAVRVNEAHLDLAELYMSGRDHVKWMEAAGRVQIAYEMSLSDDDNALAQRCLAAAPPIIARLEAAHPTMPDGLAHDFVVTRFMFDEKGRPYPSRAVRTQRMADLMRELVRVRGTGSNEELRLMRELGSNMGGAKAQPPSPRRLSAVLPVVQRIVNGRVGRNDPCPCGSGRKYKQCHA